jgi:hypothetical protein
MVKLKPNLKKMAAHSGQTDTAIGTVGGTVVAVIGNIQPNDLIKTVILATIGALVSFSLSMLMKWAAKKMRRPPS